MEISVADQTVTFFLSILLGAGLCIIFDVFRVIRLLGVRQLVTIVIEDVAFFIICAVLTFLFMLIRSDGQVRWFILAGELIGAVFYNLTISGMVIFVIKKLIEAGYAVIIFANRKIISPILSLIGRVFKKIAPKGKKIARFSKKIPKKFKYSLKQVHQMMYNQHK